MPRVLSRSILRTITAPSCVPLEVLEVALDPPYEVFQYFFVNNVEVTTFAGTTYSPLGFSRGAFESESGAAVDRVTLSVDDVGKFWAKVTTNRVIAGARIRIRKIFVGHLEYDRDAITIFDGSIGSPTFDEGTFAVEIRSIGDYQQTELPQRTHQPNCNHFLGNSRCGVDMTDPINRRIVVAGPGSTRGILKAKGIGGVGAQHWAAGYVLCTAGPEQGQVRPILASYGNQIELVVPFGLTMEGSKFSVSRGCRKTKEDCAARFQNIDNYGGFSEVPTTPIIDV